MVIKFPCGSCCKPVAKNHEAITCDNCHSWIHRSCVGLSRLEYKKLLNLNRDFGYVCSKCLFQELPLSGSLSPLDSSIEDFSRVSAPLYDFILPNNEISSVLKSSTRSDIITYCYFNVRSLTSKLEEIKSLIATAQPSFIAIVETWLDTSISNELISIQNYKIARKDRLKDTRGGGIIVYVRSDIVFKLEEDIGEFSSFEILKLTLSSVAPTNHCDIVILYRPPNSSNFIDQLSSLMESLNISTNPTYLIGDFNIDLSKKSNLSVNLSNMMNLFSFSQTVKNKTRISPTSSTLIDHIWTNRPELVEAIYHSVGFSDHLLLSGIFHINSRKKPKPKSFKTRNWRTFDSTSFMSDLATQPWYTIMLLDDLNDQIKLFSDLMNHTLDKNAPIIEVSKKKIHKKAPWVDHETRNLIMEKDKLKQKALIYGDHSLWTNYKKAKNKLTSLLRFKKRAYYSNKINDGKEDPKNMWKIINELNGKVAKDSNQIPPIDTNILNNHFTTIGQKIHNKILQPFSHPDQLMNHFKRSNSSISDSNIKFNFGQIDENYIHNIIMKIPDSSSVGIDQLYPKILKLSLPITLEFITYFINKSLFTGVFPYWKKTLITPIFKGGDKLEPGNYRPIAILPILGKVLERVVKDQLLQFLDTLNFISSRQSGFRKHHSTQTCLLSLTNKWYTELDKGNSVVVSTIDLKKAFDSVSIELLLIKLIDLGILGNELNWFINYLFNRPQMVKFMDTYSDCKLSNCGIPQGSVLGPLLFVIYVNELPSVTKHSDIHMFADDIIITSSGKNLDSIKLNLQEDLMTIKKWLNYNLLSIHTEKTNCTVLSSRANFKKRNTEKFFLTIDDINIHFSHSIKFLGITIDCFLTWDEHINILTKKTLGQVRMLFRLRNFLGIRELCIVYNTLIAAHLNYCDLVWGVCGKSLQKRLQIVLNTAARAIIFGSGRSSASEALKKLNWMPLYLKRSLHYGQMIWKGLNDKAPEDLSLILKERSIVHNISTRLKCSNGLSVRIRNTSLGGKSFSNMAPKIWNTIPADIRNSDSQESFRNNYYKYLMSL